MKNTLKVGIVAFLGAVSSQAATTISPTNAVGGGSGFVTQVQLTAGVPFTAAAGAQLMVGTFTTTAGLGAAGTITLDSFGWTQFGSSVAFSAAQPGVFGAFGGTGVTGTLPTTNTGLVGDKIFAVVSNGAGEFLIWEANTAFFPQEVEGLGGPTTSFNTNNATLLRGEVVVGGNTGLTGALATRNGSNAVTFLTAIPEPSTALLSAFAALGLLRRRR